MRFQSLVFNALSARPATHSLLVLWMLVWREAQQGPDGRRNGQIATAIGKSISYVRHALRVLERLGLVVLRHSTRDGYDAIYVRRALPLDDARVFQILDKLAQPDTPLTISIATETVIVDDERINLASPPPDTDAASTGHPGVFWLETPPSDASHQSATPTQRALVTRCLELGKREPGESSPEALDVEHAQLPQLVEILVAEVMALRAALATADQQQRHAPGARPRSNVTSASPTTDEDVARARICLVAAIVRLFPCRAYPKTQKSHRGPFTRGKLS